MPNPVVGIAGAAIGGIVSSNRAASAQRSAASKAADATAYSTDRQIEAAEDARRVATRAASKGNKIATDALITGATGKANALTAASREGQNALATANKGAADTLVHNALAGRDALVKGTVGAVRAEVDANKRNMGFFKNILGAQGRQLEDWRVAGRLALAAVDKGLKDGSFSMDTWKFEADPGYEFRRSEGERALERSAAARGGLLSGNAIASAMDFNSGLASEEYAAAYGRGRQARLDEYGRLIDVADRGQRAAEGMVDNYDTYAARIGQGNLNIGNAIAEGRRERAGFDADFADTRGRVRAAQHMTRGDIRAGGAAFRGNVAAGLSTDIGAAKAQGALNVADAASMGAMRSGNVIANAWGQYGTGMGNAAAARGNAAVTGAQGVNDAIQSSIGNWLVYDMVNKNPELLKGTNLLAGLG